MLGNEFHEKAALEHQERSKMADMYSQLLSFHEKNDEYYAFKKEYDAQKEKWQKLVDELNKEYLDDIRSRKGKR